MAVIRTGSEHVKLLSLLVIVALLFVSGISAERYVEAGAVRGTKKEDGHGEAVQGRGKR